MPRKPPYFFQPNEKKAFLKACEDNPRNHAIFKTLFYSGMTISELLGDKRTGYRGLYVEDINLTSTDEKTFDVRVLGKGKKERWVLVSKQAIEDILRYLGDRRTGKIFDITPRMVQKLARKYAKEAGLPDWDKHGRWSPHKARHTLINEIIRKTGDYLAAVTQTGKQPPPDIPITTPSTERRHAVMKKVFEER